MIEIELKVDSLKCKQFKKNLYAETGKSIILFKERVDLNGICF